MRLHPARVATYYSRERRDLVLLGQLLVLFRVDLEHYKQAKVSEVKQKESGRMSGNVQSAPDSSLTTFSSTGPRKRQGPHQL